MGRLASASVPPRRDYGATSFRVLVFLTPRQKVCVAESTRFSLEKREYRLRHPFLQP